MGGGGGGVPSRGILRAQGLCGVKVELAVGVLASPSLIVPNGLCGRKATLNLNVTSCWGSGVWVEMREVGIVQISDRFITQSAEQTATVREVSTGTRALSHPQSE